MAMIGIQAPEEICSKLTKIKVPGKKLDCDEYHITLFYIEDGIKFPDLIEYLEVLLPLVSEKKPFQVKLDEVNNFPKGVDGVPLICPVKSPALKKLRGNLAEALDKKKLKYSKRFPEYKPHLTLAYNEEEIEMKEFSPIEWEVKEITFYSDYRKVNKALKLNLPLDKKLATHSGTLMLKLAEFADILSM